MSGSTEIQVKKENVEEPQIKEESEIIPIQIKKESEIDLNELQIKKENEIIPIQIKKEGEIDPNELQIKKEYEKHDNNSNHYLLILIFQVCFDHSGKSIMYRFTICKGPCFDWWCT